MKNIRIRLVILSLVMLSFLVPGIASALSITTTYATNNGFAGNMFDVTTFGNPLTVTGIDVHVETTSSHDISLYTKLGTYVGSESNSAPWSLVGTVTVMGAGTGSPTYVNLPDFGLNANTLYGFYVDLANYLQTDQRLLYTNDSNVYANADLQVSTGIAKGTPAFAGSTFSPRTWNGTIYYETGSTVPEPATMLLLGTGFIGLAVLGRKRLLKR